MLELYPTLPAKNELAVV